MLVTTREALVSFGPPLERSLTSEYFAQESLVSLRRRIGTQRRPGPKFSFLQNEPKRRS